MNIDMDLLILLWWSFAGPFTLGVLACLQLTRLRDIAARLAAYVLPIPFCMKLIIGGSDIHASAPFFVSGIAATLVLTIAVRLSLQRWSGYASLAIGWCVYAGAAYGLFKAALYMPPVVWAVLILLLSLVAIRYVFVPHGSKEFGQVASTKPNWKAVWVRMGIAFAYINIVVAMKDQLGPEKSLALVAFPSIFALTSFLAVWSGGEKELARFLRSYVTGIPSCAAFALTLTVLPGTGVTVAVAACAGFGMSFVLDKLIKLGATRSFKLNGSSGSRVGKLSRLKGSGAD